MEMNEFNTQGEVFQQQQNVQHLSIEQRYEQQQNMQQQPIQQQDIQQQRYVEQQQQYVEQQNLQQPQVQEHPQQQIQEQAPQIEQQQTQQQQTQEQTQQPQQIQEPQQTKVSLSKEDREVINTLVGELETNPSKVLNTLSTIKIQSKTKMEAIQSQFAMSKEKFNATGNVEMLKYLNELESVDTIEGIENLNRKIEEKKIEIQTKMVNVLESNPKFVREILQQMKN